MNLNSNAYINLSNNKLIHFFMGGAVLFPGAIFIKDGVSLPHDRNKPLLDL